MRAAPKKTPARGASPEQGAPPRLSTILASAMARLDRRSEGAEKPVPLPWATLNEQFGGGLWPGLHVINKGTGVGGTQLVLAMAVHAASSGVPVLYVGLELKSFDLATRVLGTRAGVAWSSLWRGQENGGARDRVRRQIASFDDVPFHFLASSPRGLSTSTIRDELKKMRALYPDADGSRPMVAFVDYLQIVAPDAASEGKGQDLRVRIGDGAYALRDASDTTNTAIVCISSVSRERYALLADVKKVADLTWERDELGRPTHRRIGNPEAIVGAGKESGEIEFSADSVTLLAPIRSGRGSACDVVVATAKGRATGPSWSVMHFTGFEYREPQDGGAQLVDLLEEREARRSRHRNERKVEKASAKVAAHEAKVSADAASIRAYVSEHPGCIVSETRKATVADRSERWAAAVAHLGKALLQTQVGQRVVLSLSSTERTSDAE